jgi:hypothetical protein
MQRGTHHETVVRRVRKPKFNVFMARPGLVQKSNGQRRVPLLLSSDLTYMDIALPCERRLIIEIYPYTYHEEFRA